MAFGWVNGKRFWIFASVDLLQSPNESLQDFIRPKKNADNPNLNQQFVSTVPASLQLGILKKHLFWGDDFLVGSKSQAFEPHVGGSSLTFRDPGAGCVCS